jgi:hypothetical protein
MTFRKKHTPWHPIKDMGMALMMIRGLIQEEKVTAIEKYKNKTASPIASPRSSKLSCICRISPSWVMWYPAGRSISESKAST